VTAPRLSGTDRRLIAEARELPSGTEAIRDHYQLEGADAVGVYSYAYGAVRVLAIELAALAERLAAAGEEGNGNG
jgi:hypothetical protein